MKPHVALLPYLPEHRPLLAFWLEKERIRRFWGDPEEALALSETPRGGGQALIAADGRAVGYLMWGRLEREELDRYGLYEIPSGIMEIDLLVGDEEALGKGVATEALKLLVQELFEDPSVWVVGMGIAVENQASLRVAEKAGFFQGRILETEDFGREQIVLRYPPSSSRPPQTGLALISPRLHLRPWTWEDRAAFTALWGDPAVTWWGKRHDPAFCEELLERILGRCKALPFGLGWWAVLRRDTEEIIGNAVLALAPFHPAPELGYHFRPCGQGQGFATEAGQTLLHHAFETLRLPVVSAIVATQNLRSQGVIARLGFTPIQRRDYAGLPHILYEKHREPFSEAKPSTPRTSAVLDV